MVEKVLPYDRSIVPQETYYWCGPASTQIVLNSLGVRVSEAELAKQMRTHVGGTDHIGLITPVLNKYTKGEYFTVQMPKDPPTDAQRDRLWADLVRSIDGGHGLVVNIVAPPSNYPKGVKGSKSPNYGRGTIYHYIAVMGYDDDPRARSVWVADSGFQPQGYWLSFDQLVTLVPPKGYAAASKARHGVVDAPAREQATPDVAQILSEAMRGSLALERYTALAPAFASAMREAGCNTVERAAMWCAQLGHESGGLRWMEEIADGSAYEGRRDLGNVQAGDGRRFKGRGPIQVTGRYNYTELSKWAHSQGLIPSPTFFVDHPERLSDDTYGFLGPVWYWTVARDMNSYADRKDIVGATIAVNGGTNGFDDRRARWDRCLAMGDRLLRLAGLPAGADTEGSDDELTPDEKKMLRDVHRELTQRYPSRSDLRSDDEPVDTLAGFVLNIDGRIHEQAVEGESVGKQLDAILVALEAVIVALNGGKK